MNDEREVNGIAKSGFVFVRGSRLSKSKLLSSSEVSAIPDGKGNDDDLFIFCGKCGTYMDFFAGADNSLDGKWNCPGCGRSVREATPYKQLDRENSQFDIPFEDEWDE